MLKDAKEVLLEKKKTPFLRDNMSLKISHKRLWEKKGTIRR